MKIAIRADSSVAIGSGHVMRCLTLADGLKQRGADVMFICREHPGNMIGLIAGRGYLVLRLQQPEAQYVAVTGDVAHAAWLGVSWQQDAAGTIAALGEVRADWLIVDHYALDRRWEQALRPRVGSIMVLDDLADRPHDCQMLLDQNLGRSADTYTPLVPTDCMLFLGAQHSLLRPEFAALRAYSLKRRQTPRFEQLLVTMGGVDKDDATGDVLSALKECQLPENCRIKIVMGPTAPWLDSVCQTARTLPWDVEVKVNVTDMAQLMAESDFAIGAAGSTSWERCCLGLPAIMIVLAENQELAARQLEQSGAAILLDRHWQPAQLQSVLHSVISAPEAMHRMALAASEITDGAGTSSVLKYLVM